MSCGVSCRCGLDPALLRLWCRLVAVAPIEPLAWEPPYAAGLKSVSAALKSKKKKKSSKSNLSLKVDPVNKGHSQDLNPSFADSKTIL